MQYTINGSLLIVWTFFWRKKEQLLSSYHDGGPQEQPPPGHRNGELVYIRTLPLLEIFYLNAPLNQCAVDGICQGSSTTILCSVSYYVHSSCDCMNFCTESLWIYCFIVYLSLVSTFFVQFYCAINLKYVKAFWCTRASVKCLLVRLVRILKIWYK